MHVVFCQALKVMYKTVLWGGGGYVCVPVRVYVCVCATVCMFVSVC